MLAQIYFTKFTIWSHLAFQQFAHHSLEFIQIFSTMINNSSNYLAKHSLYSWWSVGEDCSPLSSLWVDYQSRSMDFNEPDSGRRVNSPIGLAGETMSVGNCCPIVTFNVENTFDSANWGWIKSILDELGVLCYLARLNESYLSERSDTRRRTSRKSILRQWVFLEVSDGCSCETLPGLGGGEAIHAIKLWLRAVLLDLTEEKMETILTVAGSL